MTAPDFTIADVPNADDWLVIRDWGLSVRQVAKVTPKLLKFTDGRYPTQIGIGDRKIICRAPDKETAERLRDSIAGIDGEYNRRCGLAREEHNARTTAAKESRDKSIARLLSPSQ